MLKIDRPTSKNFTTKGVIEQLKQFRGTGIIQTMILRGDGIDNTTDEEIKALNNAYKAIGPREIMIYSIDRKTPDQTLRKVEADELQAIATRIAQATGISVKTA